MSKGSNKPLCDLTNNEDTKFYKIIQESLKYRIQRTRNKQPCSNSIPTEYLQAKICTGNDRNIKISNRNSVASHAECSILEEGCAKKVPESNCRLMMSARNQESNYKYNN